MRELLFKVIADGHEYRIYNTGEVEGFPGEQILVFNRLVCFEAQAISEYAERHAS